MSTIFHLGAFQAFFLAVLIFSKKQKELSDFILGGWLIIMAFNIFSSHFILHHYIAPSMFMVFNFSLLFLHLPLFYIYLSSLLNSYSRLQARYFVHFLPFLLVNLVFLFVPFKGITEIKELGITDFATVVELFFFITFIVSTPVYVIYVFRILDKYDEYIMNEYSSIEDISFSWLKKCNYGILAVWIVFVVGLFIETKIPFTRFGNSLDYTFYAITLFIFYIGYFGLRQTNIFAGIKNKGERKNDKTNSGNSEDKLTIDGSIENNDNLQDKSTKTELSNEEIGSYVNCLMEYMDKSKPYLNSKITIRELASKINIPVNLLSRIVNSELNQNFFDFINKYRVEEFKRLLAENHNKRFTLLSLAYSSGFNSKSSFNSIFKKHTGSTPTEYVNAQGEINSN